MRGFWFFVAVLVFLVVAEKRGWLAQLAGYLQGANDHNQIKGVQVSSAGGNSRVGKVASTPGGKPPLRTRQPTSGLGIAPSPISFHVMHALR